MEVSCQLLVPTALPRGQRPGTHSVGGWVGPTTGPDAAAKRKKFLPLAGIETVFLSRPAHSLAAVLD